MKLFTRRQFVTTAGAATATLSLSPALSLAQAAARLRCFWWGNPDRDRRTKAMLDAYSKKSGTQIAAESLGWGDYWTKLGTQTAGGNAPDLIQMDYRYLFEYARRETLLPLDKLLPLPDFSPQERDGGKVDGKLYGVSLGSNSKAMVYDTGMLEKVGVKTMDMNWTWDDFAKIAGDISKINPGKYWGASDNSRWEQGFEQWLNQRGKMLYTADGKAAFTRDDVAAWFDLWDKLRKAGAVPPAEVGATNNGKVEEYEITRGLAAMSFVNSNQIVAFQGLNKNKLAISVFPRTKTGTSGHYIKPSQMMSISSRCKAPEEAARIIQFMVNDPEGVRILGIERGVPCSVAARAVLTPELDALGKMQVDFIAALSKVAVALPPPPPKGAGEVENLLRRVADSVAFGRVSIKDAAQQFHTEVQGILARA
ncbi:ABC transporter substrate-binding protein [Polaromonas sp.]|uniref:ABC transporter substrate-binding protein n=1 Tax=Polaromonas sp. TaxID=1869339 RepID=UPI002FC5F757